MGECCSRDDRDHSNQATLSTLPAGFAGANGDQSEGQRVHFIGSPRSHGVPGAGGNSSNDPPFYRPTNPLTEPSTLTPVEQVDMVRSRLKATRDKVRTIHGRYQAELRLIEKELEHEKSLGLPDRVKAKYLLKQEKLYRTNVQDLLVRDSIIAKALIDVNQQHIDYKVIGAIEAANKYMRDVQEELERKNWKDVIRNAAQGNYKPLELEHVQEDPEVQALYRQLEREVAAKKAEANHDHTYHHQPLVMVKASSTATPPLTVQVPSRHTSTEQRQLMIS